MQEELSQELEDKNEELENARARIAELEAELASLRAPSPGSSAGDTTRFEEVDPEDVSGDESVGSPVRPGDARRSSWWGWGGAASGAYSKVKTD